MNILQSLPSFPAMRIIKFGVVGGLGVLINVGLLHVFTTYLHCDYKIGSILAIECALINNFLWNFFWNLERPQEQLFKRDIFYVSQVPCFIGFYRAHCQLGPFGFAHRNRPYALSNVKLDRNYLRGLYKFHFRAFLGIS